MTWRRKTEIDPDLEREIMSATYRALKNHGYADLTVRDIGTEFDRSRSLIHYHYNSKEELITSFLDYLMESYNEYLVVDEDADPLTRLYSFIDHFLFVPEDATDDELDYWGGFRVQYELRVQALHDESAREFMGTNYERNVDRLVDIIEDGIKDGSFRPVDPEGTAHLILGAIDAARGRKILYRDDDAPAEMREAIDEVIVFAMRADREEV